MLAKKIKQKRAPKRRLLLRCRSEPLKRPVTRNFDFGLSLWYRVSRQNWFPEIGSLRTTLRRKKERVLASS